MPDQGDIENDGTNQIAQTVFTKRFKRIYSTGSRLFRTIWNQTEEIVQGIVHQVTTRRIEVNNKQVAEHLPLLASTGNAGKTHEVLVEEPIKPSCVFPIFTSVLSLVQVILYFTVPTEDVQLLFGYDPYRRHEIWRFLTSMLAHGSKSHLWENVIFQLILGVPLEMVYYWKKMSPIYMASVFGGSLFVTVLDPKSFTIGASGGVYGLLFAHLATIVLHWADVGYSTIFWVTLFMGQNIMFTLLGGGTASHAAHIGGAVTGFLVAMLVLKTFEGHQRWWKLLQKLCAGLIICLVTIILILNVCFPSYYAESDVTFDYQGTRWKNEVVTAIANGDSYFLYSCKDHDECRKYLLPYVRNETKPQI